MALEEAVIAGDSIQNSDELDLPPASPEALRVELQMMLDVEAPTENMLPVLEKAFAYLKIENARFRLMYADILNAKLVADAEEYALWKLKNQGIKTLSNLFRRHKVCDACKQQKIIEPNVKDTVAAYGLLRSRHPEFAETKKALVQGIRSVQELVQDELRAVSEERYRELALLLVRVDQLADDIAKY